MTRRLLNLLTVVSLLLCVVVYVLWLRSYWVGDRVKCEVVKDVAPERPHGDR